MGDYRSKARIPALSYYYKSNGACMLRSSQPRVGMFGKRCKADMKLFELCQISSIIDARPKANAVANQAKGGGYENVSHYSDVTLDFVGIENIHVMRDALGKVVSICSSVYEKEGNVADWYVVVFCPFYLVHSILFFFD